MVDADPWPLRRPPVWRAAPRRFRQRGSMSRSLAPSPTAIVSAGLRPRRSADLVAARQPWQRARGSARPPRPRQPAVLCEKPVGATFLKADRRGDRPGEKRRSRPTRGPSRPPCRPAWWRTNSTPAGGERDPPLDDAGDDRNPLEPLQQGDPFTQRRLEGDLAIHRARLSPPRCWA